MEAPLADAPEPQDDEPISREQMVTNMLRSTAGLRELQAFLADASKLDDAQFDEVTGGTDRAEAMELLDRLNTLLSEMDGVIEQIHEDEPPASD
jgi:hypothetical protein